MTNFNFELEHGKTLKKQKKYLNYKKVISIITPAWNPTKNLIQTAHCILNQTYPYFEWIIVDDGSDNKESLKLLKEIEKMDNRISVLHKKNEGLSKTRDYGVNHSSKETNFVVFVDDDDLLDSTYLECAYYTMVANPSASWCYSDVVNFEGIESLWNKSFSCERMKYENLLVSQAMVKKDAYYDVGGFSLSENGHYEDWIFWLKLMAKGHYPIHMSFYGFWYRRKRTSGQLKFALEHEKENMKEIEEYASKIQKNVSAIEFPRENYNWDGIREKLDVVVPKFEDNQKTNILVMVPWMTIGGADKFNLDLFKMIDKRKYSITLISMQPTEYIWRQQFEEVCDAVFDLSTFIDRKDWLSFINYIIDSRGIDIIFNTNSLTGYMMLPYLHAKYPKIPILDYIHMEEWYNRNGGYSRDSAAVGSVIDKTLFCNKNSEKILIQHFHRNPESVGTIYIGVDAEKFNPKNYNSKLLREKYKVDENKFVISLIARIDYQKRPYLLMRIIEETVKRNEINNLLFFIAGDGPLLKEIKRIAKKKNLNNYVKFIGKTSTPDEIYAISDMTLNCSIKEGLALTSYESLSMGVPVVSCDVGGQKELIDENVGVIVPCLQDETQIHDYNYSQEDVGNYVDGIIKIYNNIDFYKKNCRKKILNGFTIQNMVVNMEKEFEKLSKLEKDDNTILSNHLDVMKELLNEYFVGDKALYGWLCNQYKKVVYGPDEIEMTRKQKIAHKWILLGSKLNLTEEFEIAMHILYELARQIKHLFESIIMIPFLIILLFIKLFVFEIYRIRRIIKRKVGKK